MYYISTQIWPEIYEDKSDQQKNKHYNAVYALSSKNGYARKRKKYCRELNSQLYV